MDIFDSLLADLAEIRPVRHFGQVSALNSATVIAQGLTKRARLGDRVLIANQIGGEILSLGRDGAEILPEAAVEGLSIGAPVEHLGKNTIAPDSSWIGRIIDPYGAPLDGLPLDPEGATLPPGASLYGGLMRQLAQRIAACANGT